MYVYSIYTGSANHCGSAGRGLSSLEISHLQPHRAASRPTSARSCGLYSSSSAMVVGTVGCFIRLLSCAERTAGQRAGEGEGEGEGYEPGLG